MRAFSRALTMNKKTAFFFDFDGTLDISKVTTLRNSAVAKENTFLKNRIVLDIFRKATNAPHCAVQIVSGRRMNHSNINFIREFCQRKLIEIPFLALKPEWYTELKDGTVISRAQSAEWKAQYISENLESYSDIVFFEHDPLQAHIIRELLLEGGNGFSLPSKLRDFEEFIEFYNLKQVTPIERTFPQSNEAFLKDWSVYRLNIILMNNEYPR